jgi:hypothetical protein
MRMCFAIKRYSSDVSLRHWNRGKTLIKISSGITRNSIRIVGLGFSVIPERQILIRLAAQKSLINQCTKQWLHWHRPCNSKVSKTLPINIIRRQFNASIPDAADLIRLTRRLAPRTLFASLIATC